MFFILLGIAFQSLGPLTFSCKGLKGQKQRNISLKVTSLMALEIGSSENGKKQKKNNYATYFAE